MKTELKFSFDDSNDDFESANSLMINILNANNMYNALIVFNYYLNEKKYGDYKDKKIQNIYVDLYNKLQEVLEDHSIILKD